MAGEERAGMADHGNAAGRNRSGLTWDWTTETWSWTPDAGRFVPDYGRPTDCVSVEVSTAPLPPEDRYDYWRETVFYYFSPDRDPQQNKHGFNARAQALIAPAGEFCVFESDAISGWRRPEHIRADDGDSIDLGLVLSGARYHEPAGDVASVARRGDAFVYDCARPSRVVWSRHRGLFLRLPRQAVQSALGGDVPGASVLACALATSNLWPFLRAQLALLAYRSPALSKEERGTILDYTIDLALSVLETLGAKTWEEGAAGGRRALFLAAQRYIDRNLSRPDLDAATIALAIGCSRATLYRAFADHGLTVVGYIREQRLQKFHRLLKTTAKGVPIAVLAEQCGLVYDKNIRRAFRRLFGITPKEARSSGSENPSPVLVEARSALWLPPRHRASANR